MAHGSEVALLAALGIPDLHRSLAGLGDPTVVLSRGAASLRAGSAHLGGVVAFRPD